MEINLAKAFYLFLRLAPFIVVSYFTLLSIFNQDLKGIIYLAGLIFSCIIALGANKYIQTDLSGPLKMECRITALGSNDEAISKIPLGVLTLAYTLVYLIYIIGTYKMWHENIPILVVFPLLLVSEVAFQIKYQCTNTQYIGFAAVIGALCGYIWGLLIDSTGYVDLQLFNGISSQQVCDRPTRSQYRCRIVKR